MFTLENLPEIHLERAPLAKVLVQIQFSRTPELVADDGEARIAKRLPRYPVRRQGAGGIMALPIPIAFPQQQMSAVRVFSDVTGAWEVTVTDTSVGIQTSEYDTRDDFCARLGEVLTAVTSVARPPVVDRVGVRYVDRLIDSDRLERVSLYIAPSMRVLYGDVSPELSLVQSVSDSVIGLNEAEQMHVRSGFLPPQVLFDPLLPPVEQPSWVLDIDVYTIRGAIEFDEERLVGCVRRFSEHAYSFFRHVTTEEFYADFVAGDAKDSGDEA